MVYVIRLNVIEIVVNLFHFQIKFKRNILIQAKFVCNTTFFEVNNTMKTDP